jgi:hypothetical protein
MVKALARLWKSIYAGVRETPMTIKKERYVKYLQVE